MITIAAIPRTKHVVEITLPKELIEMNISHPRQISIKMTTETAKDLADVLIGALPTLEPFTET